MFFIHYILTSDFKIDDWMEDHGLTSSTLQGAVLAKLLDFLGISKYLTENGCSHVNYPYKDSVDGWTKGNLRKTSRRLHSAFYSSIQEINI